MLQDLLQGQNLQQLCSLPADLLVDSRILDSKPESSSYNWVDWVVYLPFYLHMIQSTVYIIYKYQITPMYVIISYQLQQLSIYSSYHLTKQCVICGWIRNCGKWEISQTAGTEEGSNQSKLLICLELLGHDWKKQLMTSDQRSSKLIQQIILSTIQKILRILTNANWVSHGDF